jgi:hypothetical protein
LMLLPFCTSVRAHNLVDSNGRPVATHKHVWRQQTYGKDYRQGHAVDGPRGSITIWSPKTYRGYNAGSAVRFARPVPISQRPKAGDNTPAIKSASPYQGGNRNR